MSESKVKPTQSLSEQSPPLSEQSPPPLPPNPPAPESALTAPSDRDPAKTYRPNQTAPPLNDEETNEALAELNKTDFVRRFPRVERKYADPPVDLQRYGLVSFVPAKGATANEKGVYGFAKLRGNFNTQMEANERAEYLVRNVDSYHTIYHTYVGRPFPLTTSSDYSAEVEEVDMQKEMSSSISKNIKEKRAQEEKEIQEIKQQEERLLEESKREEEDPQERYTTLRVKKAQVMWTYLEHRKKMNEMKEIILKTRAEIEEMEKQDDSYKQRYFKKYMDARMRSGLTVDANTINNNFMKFLVEEKSLYDPESEDYIDWL